MRVRVGYTLTFSFSKSTLHTIQVLGFNLQHRTYMDGIGGVEEIGSGDTSLNTKNM